MKTILRTPLHGMLSAMTLVISFTGRSSGRTISTPVNYAQEGKCIYITSTRARHWWRNLSGGATVQILLKGKSVEGWAEVIDKPEQVEKHLAAYFRILPRISKYFGVEMKPNGLPDPSQLQKAAAERVGVLVKIK